MEKEFWKSWNILVEKNWVVFIHYQLEKECETIC